MAKVVADCRQIVPRHQKRDCRAVAHGVRVKTLLTQIGNIFGSAVETLGQNVADPEPGQRSAMVIQKNMSF